MSLLKRGVITCTNPPNGTNTRHEVVELRYEETYAYSCLQGYTTNDSILTTCLSNGSWSLSTAPNCIALSCGVPPQGLYTERLVEQLSSLEAYVYSCLLGYITNDSLITVCQPNGMFSMNDPPSCYAVVCPTPPPGNNVVDVPTDLVLYSLDTYTYSCIYGYHTENEMCVVCQPDGTLSMSQGPECIAITCPDPIDGDNTVQVPSPLHMKYSDTYIYSCLPGYNTTNILVTTCLVDGHLSSKNAPKCQEIICGTPEDGRYTEPATENITLAYLDMYVYSCLPGHTTEDEVVTLCNPDGTFSSDNLPECSLITCDTPLPGNKANPVEPEDLVLYHLDTYSYSCMDGYHTDDELCTVCRSDGTLSVGPPTGTPTFCPVPDSGNNTESPAAPGRYMDVFTYVCIHGYSTDDCVESICLANGTWSLEVPPSCQQECYNGVMNIGIVPETNCDQMYSYSAWLPLTTIQCNKAGNKFDFASCSC